MSASVVSSVPVVRQPNRPNPALERAFFLLMTALMLATVLWGFARTYFLAGMVAAPLPNRLIHIHGAVFSLWIIFFLAQTVLVAAGNVRLHRILGPYGFALAAFMVVLGWLAGLSQLHRHIGPLGLPPETFFIIPVTDMLLFGGFVYASWRSRRQPAAHKRLILLATICLMGAAVSRWPVAVIQAHPPLLTVVELSFVLLLVGYDLISLRRVHRTTALGLLVLALALFVRIPLGMTPPWIAFAHAVARL